MGRVGAEVERCVPWHTRIGSQKKVTINDVNAVLTREKHEDLSIAIMQASNISGTRSSVCLELEH